MYLEASIKRTCTHIHVVKLHLNIEHESKSLPKIHACGFRDSGVRLRLNIYHTNFVQIVKFSASGNQFGRHLS